MSDKCFCHLNGFEVKDAYTRSKVNELDNTKISIDSLTAKNNIKNYQEVLWLGSDLIPELPSVKPNKSSDLETYLGNLENMIWEDLTTNNNVINYGYDRIVLLAQYGGKLVKCTIRQNASGEYEINVHSSVYKENVKEIISLHTNKRYKLVKDTYTEPQEPSYFLEEIVSAGGGSKLYKHILKLNNNALPKVQLDLPFEEPFTLDTFKAYVQEKGHICYTGIKMNNGIDPINFTITNHSYIRIFSSKLVYESEGLLVNLTDTTITPQSGSKYITSLEDTVIEL